MELKQHLHMSMSSFDKLLSYIRTSLELDLDMAQPEVVLSSQRFLFIARYTTLPVVPTQKLFLLVYQKHCSTMLYGRRCMPLSDAKTYELPGRI